MEHIRLNPIGAEDFRQTPTRLAAKEIELKEPVLRGGVAKAEKQIHVIGGVNMRNAPAAAFDGDVPDRAVYTGSKTPPARRRHAPTAFARPPGAELSARQTRGGTDSRDRIAGAQPP